MAEKMSEVYSAYDMDINQVMRGRGATLLKTDKGIYQLRQMDSNDSRLKAEYEYKEMLAEVGFPNIDRCVINQDGELYTCDRYGTPFVLRKFFAGRECNCANVNDITRAVENLAKLHVAGKEVFERTEKDVHIRVCGDFKRRNQELKRVRNYILKQKSKREFEEKYLKKFSYFYEQALECNQEYLNRESVFDCEYNSHLGYCHGMYNHHSVIFFDEGVNESVGTVSFDKFYLGNQLGDLYHFMRKVVEKNDYSFDIMRTIIDVYDKICPLGKEDLFYVYINYCYPEKFYKLSNQYINAPKNWISPKMLEKLEKLIRDEDKKQNLLKYMKKIT